MSGLLRPLKPAEAARRLQAQRAVLVDIREPDEFARAHVTGALSRPLSTFEQAHLKIAPATDVIFTCRMGGRTAAYAARLAATIIGEAYVLEGGYDAWAAAGLPVTNNRKAPIEIIRQVQLIAGSLVLVGVLLGLGVHPAFFALSAMVGAGLTIAGATGFCGMARLLGRAPWNRAA